MLQIDHKEPVTIKKEKKGMADPARQRRLLDLLFGASPTETVNEGFPILGESPSAALDVARESSALQGLFQVFAGRGAAPGLLQKHHPQTTVFVKLLQKTGKRVTDHFLESEEELRQKNSFDTLFAPYTSFSQATVNPRFSSTPAINFLFGELERLPAQETQKKFENSKTDETALAMKFIEQELPEDIRKQIFYHNHHLDVSEQQIKQWSVIEYGQFWTLSRECTACFTRFTPALSLDAEHTCLGLRMRMIYRLDSVLPTERFQKDRVPYVVSMHLQSDEQVHFFKPLLTAVPANVSVLSMVEKQQNWRFFLQCLPLVTVGGLELRWPSTKMYKQSELKQRGTTLRMLNTDQEWYCYVKSYADFVENRERPLPVDLQLITGCETFDLHVLFETTLARQLDLTQAWGQQRPVTLTEVQQINNEFDKLTPSEVEPFFVPFVVVQTTFLFNV